jgi:hypothetical protein
MMRTPFAGLTVLLATLAGTMAQPEPPKPPATDDLHPAGTGHLVIPTPDVASWPKAKPEDVASIDAIVKAFYTSTEGDPGQPRDWDRFKSLFLPGAHLMPARDRGDGTAGILDLSADQYVEANRKYLERGGFVEREAARRSEEFGHIAHVWSTYESRRTKAATEPYARGIYSIQLLKDGDRWWIVNLFWDYERETARIPEKYLTTPKE